MTTCLFAIVAFVVSLAFPSIAFAASTALDQESVTIIELLASGSLGTVLGGVQAYALALYARRDTILAIDTWDEVKLLAFGMLLVAPAAYVILLAFEMSTAINVLITVAVAFLASLKANSEAIKPLGK